MKHNIMIFILFIFLFNISIVNAQIHTHKFCANAIVDDQTQVKNITAFARIKVNHNEIKEYELNLLSVKKSNLNTIYYFCKEINLSRGSYENWIKVVVNDISKEIQNETIYNKPLNCDRRFTYKVEGDEIFMEKMERYRNVGYVDIGGTCTYNNTFAKFFDLLGNEVKTCEFTLKGYGAENGTIITSRQSVANLNGTNQIGLKVTYKRTPLDDFCIFYVPQRVEIKIPKTKYLISKLKINFIDPIPDFTYEDEENLVVVWKRDESFTEDEFFNINFSYITDWGTIILGFIGMLIALFLDKLYENVISKGKFNKTEIKCPLCGNKYKKRGLKIHMLNCKYDL